MKAIKDSYKAGWQTLVKPDRYSYSEDMLGPKVFPAGVGYVHRRDFVLKNDEGFGLRCCIYVPQSFIDSKQKMPCVMYLHAHGGSVVDALSMRHYFLPRVAFCIFDFAGCGLSEGEYISLGPKEKRDALIVIDYIRKEHNVGQVFLWGRSMGAVASIMLASENPDAVSGLVLDSPFSDLTKMVKDVVTAERNLPRCLIGCVLGCLARTAKKRTGTDIRKIVPINDIQSLKLPIFMMVAKEDTLAKPSRVIEMFEKCPSEYKYFFLVEGDHVSARDSLVMLKAVNFVFKRLAMENFRAQNSIQSPLEVSEEDRERLLKEGSSIHMHDLAYSHSSEILKETVRMKSESNTPKHYVQSVLDKDWPSVTILKRELTKKPDFGLLTSKITKEAIDQELQRIKEQQSKKKLSMKAVHICFAPQVED